MLTAAKQIARLNVYGSMEYIVILINYMRIGAAQVGYGILCSPLQGLPQDCHGIFTIIFWKCTSIAALGIGSDIFDLVRLLGRHVTCLVQTKL
jgi:hypothetical protein